MEIFIDKTSPEISAAFDLELKKLQGKGTDALSGIKTILQTDTNITAQDKAGNATQFDITTKKDNTDKKKGNHNIIINILRYNEQVVHVPETNLSVSWKTDRDDKIDHLEQIFVIKDQQKIRAVYNDNRDLSTVVEKTSGEKKEKSKAQGMKIITVKSNTGKILLDL